MGPVDGAGFACVALSCHDASMSLSLADALSPAGLTALAQVIAIDLMLAGDNVVILGTLAAGLPAAQRKRVLAIGIGLALVCLIGFAWFATFLLRVVGLLFAGGLLLFWVAWRLWRELRQPSIARDDGEKPPQGMIGAVARIALADLSMSLDNVLAVAGAARDHPTVLVIGLGLSVTLVAVAANAIARLIERHRWIAYGGLMMVVWVAISMVHRGVVDPAIGVGRLIGVAG